MTPDTRTTENPDPQPTTKHGRRLYDWLAWAASKMVGVPLAATVVWIERDAAEAAQGAAPLDDAAVRVLAEYPIPSEEGRSHDGQMYIRGWNAAIRTAREESGAAPRAEGLDEAAVAKTLHSMFYANREFGDEDRANARMFVNRYRRLAPQERRD